MADQDVNGGAPILGAENADPTGGNADPSTQQAQPNGNGGTADGDASKGSANDGKTGGDILDDLTANTNSDEQKDGEDAKTPETYEPFKVPDGTKMDEGLFNEFSAVAKEMGLSQEHAQKLVDFQAKMQQKTADESSELIASWRAETNKLYSGKPEISTFVTKTLQGRPELGAVLRETGLINHPEVMKLVVDYGKALSEDLIGGGDGTSSGGSKTVGQILYPNSTK